MSYQYLEWPGDINLTFQSSPLVSYFYNVGIISPDVALQGCVCDQAGIPLAGATISASILDRLIATAQTGQDGRYILPTLSPGAYILSATKETFVSDKRALSLASDIARQDFMLRPFPALPSLQIANSTPPFSVAAIDDLEGAHLRVFDGSVFVPVVGRLPNKLTIVLTHGWNSSSDAWPSDMARYLVSKGVGAIANIVAWHWETAAHAPVLPPEEKTPRHGLALGKALYGALGRDYIKALHFMGHSLGTLVNARAANYVHGDDEPLLLPLQKRWSATRTHLTLFDEAEIARLAGKDVIVVSGAATLLGTPPAGVVVIASAVAAAGWKSPIPKQRAWIDSYVSLVGVFHDEAVNVCLQKADSLSPNLSLMHGYGYSLYGYSVTRPEDCILGFRRSFEARQTVPMLVPDFPPIEPELTIPAFYRQVPTSDRDLDFETTGKPGALDCLKGRLGGWFENTVVDSIQEGGRTVGNAIWRPIERAAVGSYRATTRLTERIENRVDAVIDLANRPDVRLNLLTGPPPHFQNPLFAMQADGEPSTNTPAYIWLPIRVPADAVAMLFDFTVSGDGKSDALAFGVNETNLFSLEMKFVQDNQQSTSRLIDISAYAGTTNDFFFGILGGTSTNCEAQIDGIRFFAFTTPALSITSSTNAVIISWPSSAYGYVLESADALDNEWSSATNPPSLFAGRMSVSVNLSEARRFFRLRQN